VREESTRQPVPFVRRVRVRNFRSIAACDVTLGPLTVLLGFNASGKTNFLDALHFVADALANGPVNAAANRGGLQTLLHRTPEGTAHSFEIWLDLNMRLPDSEEDVAATYGFEIGADTRGQLPLLVRHEAGNVGSVRLHLDPGKQSSRLRLPATIIDEDEPQAVLEAALRAMRFYDLDTAVLRELDDDPSPVPYLGPAGEHLGHVLGALAQDQTGKERLDGYLSALVPGALGVDERREGRYSTVHARFEGRDGTGPQVFLREALSEGTLRAAGVLAALFQPPAFTGQIPVIVIEEPETALHPAGVGALYEALDDASERTQVIVTSQSSDLLDNEYVKLDHIRAVSNVDGATQVGGVDETGSAIVGKGIMSISELHRSGQMRPEST
jgi:predicted ATPase